MSGKKRKLDNNRILVFLSCLFFFVLPLETAELFRHKIPKVRVGNRTFVVFS